ncbi:MAG: hypothetical protein OXE99_13880 [Cellvibrionales bacterium]|nr:hypothetical protein [Cellvibrionales bacterium]
MKVLTSILSLLLTITSYAGLELSHQALNFGKLLPAESKTLTFEITNPTKKTIDGVILLGNPGLDSTGSFGQYAKKSEASSLVSWLTLNDKTISLAPNATKTIKLTLDAPEALSGDYRAWLFIKTGDNTESILEWPYPAHEVAISAQLNQPDNALTLDSIQHAIDIRKPIAKVTNDITPALDINLTVINKSPANIETHGQCILLTKDGLPMISAPVRLKKTDAYNKQRTSCLFSHYLPKDQYLLDVNLKHKIPFINEYFTTHERVAVYIRTKDERLLMDADARLLMPDVAIQSTFKKDTKETNIRIKNLYDRPITLQLLTKDNITGILPAIINKRLMPKATHKIPLKNDASFVLSIKEDKHKMPLTLTPKSVNTGEQALEEGDIQFAPWVSVKERGNDAHIFTLINFPPLPEIQTARLTLQIFHEKNKKLTLKTRVPVVLPTHGHSPLHLVIPSLDTGKYRVVFSISNHNRMIATQEYNLQVSFSNQFKVYQSKTNRYIRKFIDHDKHE